MSVKTPLSLHEAQELFPKRGFISLVATTHGVMDSNYFVKSDTHSYIIKKFEQSISEHIKKDIALLSELQEKGFNTPHHLETNHSWHLYSQVMGTHIEHTKSFHLQVLARFLAQFHHQTQSIKREPIIKKHEILSLLYSAKKKHYKLYKELQHLSRFNEKIDGFIHGDIFKDNVLFLGLNVGLIDFIDSGSGSYAFDIAVVLIGFDALKHKKLYISLFLQAYNSHAQRKISYDTVIDYISIATHFYALKRLPRSANNAQKLLRSIR